MVVDGAVAEGVVVEGALCVVVVERDGGPRVAVPAPVGGFAPPTSRPTAAASPAVKSAATAVTPTAAAPRTTVRRRTSVAALRSALPGRSSRNGQPVGEHASPERARHRPSW